MGRLYDVCVSLGRDYDAPEYHGTNITHTS